MDEAEWQTRKKRFDTKLRSLSPQWQIVRYRDGLDASISALKFIVFLRPVKSCILAT